MHAPALESPRSLKNPKPPPVAELTDYAAPAAALLKALAHPARLVVLCRLLEGEASVGELQPLTGLSLSALSQHLAVLRGLELVHTRRDAQVIHYSAARSPALAVLEALHGAYCRDLGRRGAARARSRRSGT